jgi:hypothetical protein
MHILDVDLMHILYSKWSEKGIDYVKKKTLILKSVFNKINLVLLVWLKNE